MASTPQDVQAKLDAARTAITKTTNSYPAMVKKHGSDWTKWPTGSQWYIALNNIQAARVEAGDLVAPAPPAAHFSYKEV